MVERLVEELLVNLALKTVGAVLEVEQVGGDDVGQLGEELAVEARLDLDLAREVKLLGVGFAALVPLFENFAETDGVDLDELLSERPSVGSASSLLRSIARLRDAPAACQDRVRAPSSPPRALSTRPEGRTMSDHCSA